MTPDEILAHHAQLRKALQGQTTGLHAVSCAAIETLLAREVKVLRINDDMQLFARVKRNQIANILNPQPAALAEEKKP